MLLRTLYLSLDPYMRQLMDETGPVYAPSVRLGEPMAGGTVNRVVASRHPRWHPGDLVLGNAGRVKTREDLVDGLENAPAAFIGLLEGRNFGKLIVRVTAS